MEEMILDAEHSRLFAGVCGTCGVSVILWIGCNSRQEYDLTSSKVGLLSLLLLRFSVLYFA